MIHSSGGKEEYLAELYVVRTGIGCEAEFTTRCKLSIDAILDSVVVKVVETRTSGKSNAPWFLSSVELNVAQNRMLSDKKSCATHTRIDSQAQSS